MSIPVACRLLTTYCLPEKDITVRRNLTVVVSYAIFVATVALLWPSVAHAQWYPYPYRGGRMAEPTAELRVLVTPSDAEVYVDGYYSGIVDDFDGFFQRLHVPPGNHEIVLHLEGYRTVHQQVYVSARSTYKLRYTMEKLAAGEQSEPPPVAAAQPPEAAGPPPNEPAPEPPRMGRPPRGPGWRQPMGPPPPQQGPNASAFGTLAVRVQPADAEIVIDDERWNTSDGEARLTVQIAEGPHRVEIRRDGYVPFSSDVQVRRGETIPLNVSLSRQRD